jgi:hypothetical protein
MITLTEQNAVALKLPIFWTSQPQVWFAQAEAQFQIRGITADETKYYYVISALDQDTATRLLDLINNPPRADKYGELKDRLVSTFSPSKRECASRLLHMRPLGDSKPSALMDEMLALLGDHPPCFLFEQLFLERLPEDIRAQLVDATIDDHRELAKRADALWAVRDMGASVSSIRGRPPTKRKADINSPKSPQDNLSLAKRPRSSCTSEPHSRLSRFRIGVSITSMWIWWVPSHHPRVIHTSSPWLTALLAGQRQFPSIIQPH